MNALVQFIVVKDERLIHLQKFSDFDMASLPQKGDFIRMHPYSHLEVIERHILYYPTYATVDIFMEDKSILSALKENKAITEVK